VIESQCHAVYGLNGEGAVLDLWLGEGAALTHTTGTHYEDDFYPGPRLSPEPGDKQSTLSYKYYGNHTPNLSFNRSITPSKRKIKI